MAGIEIDEQRLSGEMTALAVEGELDLATAPTLARTIAELMAAGYRWFVIDLNSLEFIDSTGLSVLMNALRRLTRARGGLAIACSRPQLLRAFTITRLDGLFDLFPERDAAVTGLRLRAARGRTT